MPGGPSMIAPDEGGAVAPPMTDEQAAARLKASQEWLAQQAAKLYAATPAQIKTLLPGTPPPTVAIVKDTKRITAGSIALGAGGTLVLWAAGALALIFILKTRK